MTLLRGRVDFASPPPLDAPDLPTPLLLRTYPYPPPRCPLPVLKDGGDEMSVTEYAGARSFSWAGGCLSPHTCIGLTLTPAKPSGGGGAESGLMRESQLLQLSAT